MIKRTVLIAIILLVISVLIALIPAVRGLWVMTDQPVAAWRSQLIAESGSVENALAEAAEEIARLRTQHAEAVRRLAEFEEILNESNLDPEQVVLTRATVVARSTGPGAQVLEINRGAVDRVRKHMAITVGWSLIGVVIGEQAGRSLVRLLTDAQSRIPAKIIGPDGAVLGRGVCAGTGDLRQLDLRMVEDQPGLIVEAGQYVVSAGGPGVVPPDLILGVIEQARREEASDHWAIDVEPLREVGATVLVLKEADW